MALTDTKIKNAKPREKVYRLADGNGLCLEVRPAGSKCWRYRYRVDGKEKMLALGQYPMVGLADARERHLEARKLLSQGLDPSTARREAQQEARAASETFEDIAREWMAKSAVGQTPAYAEDAIGRLERHVFPHIGRKPIRAINAQDIAAMLKVMEHKGIIDTACRQLQKVGQVFNYAIRTGRADHDPSAVLKGTIPPKAKKHRAAITDPRAVGELLRAIDGYGGDFTTLCALRFAPLVFVRPGELRRAEWSEFDFQADEWRIPADKMKMRVEHVVPLSVQALAILAELQPVTGSGKYVFPSVRTASRPMSENTINAALRRMGYTKEEMTGHGFRTTASTLLNEMGWNRDAIERQLAHVPQDEVRAAYNRSMLLPERRKMIQAWADYLDSLKAGGTVLPFRTGTEE